MMMIQNNKAVKVTIVIIFIVKLNLLYTFLTTRDKDQKYDQQLWQVELLFIFQLYITHDKLHFIALDCIQLHCTEN